MADDPFMTTNESTAPEITAPEITAPEITEVTRFLARAGEVRMPDDVFATISRALAIEVELRREGVDDTTAQPRTSTAPGFDKDFDPLDDPELDATFERDLDADLDADLESLCVERCAEGEGAGPAEDDDPDDSAS